jgi:hypothetical protein
MPSFFPGLSPAERGSIRTVLFEKFMDSLRGHRLGKSAGKHQNASLSNQPAAVVHRFQPKTISFHEKAKFVSASQIELFAKGLGQHDPPCFIHLNGFFSHAIYYTIYHAKMEEATE